MGPIAPLRLAAAVDGGTDADPVATVDVDGPPVAVPDETGERLGVVDGAGWVDSGSPSVPDPPVGIPESKCVTVPTTGAVGKASDEPSPAPPGVPSTPVLLSAGP